MTTGIFPVKYVNSTHTPMQAGDTVDPTTIPKSVRTQNQLQLLTDGLYVGSGLSLPAYYVGSAGTDAPTSGPEGAPYKTLDYALQQISAQSTDGSLSSKFVLALKAGETFTMVNSYNVTGDMTLAFWGSAYGDYNSPVVGSGCAPAYMSDLARPIIQSQPVNQTNGLYGCTGLRLQANSRLKLTGVQVNFASKPTASPALTLYDGTSDFVTGDNYGTSSLILDGVVANCTDTNSVYGLVGVKARGTLNLMQYATQFKVLGALTVSGSPTANILVRQYFIKMYPDYAGNNQNGVVLSTSLSPNASSGSGFMNLAWSLTQGLIVTGSTPSLATYPTLSDVDYGLRNYVTGIIRDQQFRPLNVICSQSL